MPKLTFVTQSSRFDSAKSFTSERLVNLYPVAGPAGAKSPILLRPVLGQSVFSSISVGITRAIAEVNGVLYIVGSGSLYSLTEAGVWMNLGSIDDDVVTTISGNGDYVVVVAGGKYYVYDGVSISEPAGGRFDGGGTATYIDNRTIITEYGGQEFEWTDLADPTSRQALNYATNGSKNDKTLLVLADRRELWFFGEDSSEVFYNTGQSGPDAFVRISGGAIETGILAANLAVKMSAGIFLVGNDGVAYITNGLNLTPVSTPAISQAINKSTPTHCFYYEDDGHKFCVIRFGDRPAYVFDITTGIWHERATGEFGPWEVVGMAKLAGSWHCALDSGKVYKVGRTGADISGAIIKTAISKTLTVDGKLFGVGKVEVLASVGASDIGRDAVISMAASKDSGLTWGTARERSLGDLGDTMQVVKWHGNGRWYNFAVKLQITDPADVSLYGDVNIEVS